MLPITKKITAYNHNTDNTTSDIDYIVVHDTGNQNDSDEGNAKYFSVDGRKASAHYFVDDDSITQVVEDKDIAWHVGDGKGKYGILNKNSLGVEMCRVNGTVTAKTEDNTVELVKYLMGKYPKAKVVRHYDASRKNCPASFSPNNWERWTSFLAKLTTQKVDDARVYTVVAGDTLWDIAVKLYKDGAKYRDIVRLNNLTTNMLKVGQKLKY